MVYYLALAIIGLGIGVSSVFALPQENTYVKDLEQTTQSVLGMETGPKREVFGFLPFWLAGQANKDHETYLSTLGYFGVGLNGDGTIQEFANPGEKEPGLNLLQKDSFQRELQNAKENNVRLSLVVHLMDANDIETLLTDPEEHAGNLIEEVGPLMKEYGFTDLNIDIERVGYQSEDNRQRFTTFVREVRKGVDEQKLGTMGIDVIAKSLVEPHLTDVASLEPYVDYIVLMTYDFHYVGSYIAGPVAPIQGVGIKREYDVEATVQEALKIAPPEKIILGIPLYGYEWDTITNVPGGPTVRGTGKVKTHKQIKRIQDECDTSCISGVDEVYLQPYIIKPADDGNGEYYRQIFYEDVASMKRKFDLVEQYNIGGIALWALGYEDRDMTDAIREYKPQ